MSVNEKYSTFLWTHFLTCDFILYFPIRWIGKTDQEKKAGELSKIEVLATKIELKEKKIFQAWNITIRWLLRFEY